MPVREKILNCMPYSWVRNYKMKKKLIPSALEPAIYNDEGQKIRTYYLQDELCEHNPYSLGAGRLPKYILWDRFNYGLNRHVYTHRNILRMCGTPQKKYALFLESAAILPGDYMLFEGRETLAKEFEMIFTHSERLLNKFENARWIPGGHVWYGGIGFESEVSSTLYLRKTKNISMISSDKKKCLLHKMRIETIQKLQSLGLVDGYGNYPGSPNGKTNISETLKDYRYSVIFENNIEDYYFTEKILNCFESMTVPVYLGARKIGDFFNADGIVQLKMEDVEHIDSIIKGLNERDYYERVPAIVDNFNRVQDFICFEDYIYNHYLKEN